MLEEFAGERFAGWCQCDDDDEPEPVELVDPFDPFEASDEVPLDDAVAEESVDLVFDLLLDESDESDEDDFDDSTEGDFDESDESDDRFGGLLPWSFL